MKEELRQKQLRQTMETIRTGNKVFLRIERKTDSDARYKARHDR